MQGSEQPTPRAEVGVRIGLLRQHLPKGEDFDAWPDEEVP